MEPELTRKRAVIEIEWQAEPDSEVGASLIEQACDRLMNLLIAHPSIVDPDISATLNAAADG